MLAMLILFSLGEANSGAYVTLAVGIFILPSILLSALGGEIADSHDKAVIAQRLKLAEIGVQTVAACGFVLNSLSLLYLALFGLGTLSSLFGPIKYGILPDQLETRELTAGNALIEGATFLAILLGLIVGGLTVSEARQSWSVVLQLMAIALACWATSRFIPATGAGAPDLRPSPNIFASTWRALKNLKAQPREWTGGVAVSWFWMTGAVALSLVPVVIKQRVGGGVAVETAISAVFAVGIALGSLAAAAWARGRIFLGAAPGAAAVMGLFLFDLAFTAHGAHASGPGLSLASFLASSDGIRLGIDVMGLAAAGGVYVVPVFAAVQAWAGQDRRARVVAAVNILNSIFIVVGSLLTSALQALGASETLLLAALGAVNMAVAVWVYVALSRQDVGSISVKTH
jgi:acyl-[acyl-carrier-protein]-phospholipid O-acyltransferase / long-chain-fatty-acid--[acyl-carrier-protein] ligase